MVKFAFCADCFEECKIGSTRCVTCSAKHTAELKRIRREKKKQRKTFSKICGECNENYEAYNEKQKFCTDACRQKNKVKTANSRWVISIPKKTDCHLNDRIENARVKKNPALGILKKFKAVRG